MSPEAEKTEQKAARILQISDLHFGNHDPNAWTEVVRLVKSLSANEKLSYVVVTGDLQNHFFAGASEVKAALAEIAKLCGRLLVVPGNHDYLIYGLIDRVHAARWVFLPALAAVTAALCLGHAVVAAAAGVVASMAAAYLWYPQWSFRHHFAGWWSGREVVVDDENGLVLALLDSNSAWSHWARGRIGGLQLDWLSSRLSTLKTQRKDAYSRLIKIAVMHHHPFPIVPAERSMGLFSGRKVDKMLMLDDASETLRTLADEGFDVVMHGHKHKAAATRLATEVEEGGIKRQMLVVACGTSCLKGAGLFSANLFTVLPTHHVVLERFFTADPRVKGFEPTEPMLVPTRLIDADASEVGYKSRKYRYSFRIDEEGDSHFVSEVCDLEPTHRPLKKLAPIEIRQPCGTLHDPRFESKLLNHSYVSATNSGIKCEIGPWTLAPGLRADYRFSYWTMGMWVLNLKEKELVYGHGPAFTSRTGCYVSVVRPADSVEISIQLPECCRPGKPKLDFYTLKDQKNIPQLARILESGFLWSPERNFIGIKLSNPPLGLYEITWDLPPGPDELVSDQQAHSAARDSWEELRRDLLAMGAAGAAVAARKFAEDVRTIMDSVGPMLAAALGHPASAANGFDVSLMVYDSSGDGKQVKPGLSVVARNSSQAGTPPIRRLPVGTGIAGRACKTGKALVYSPVIQTMQKPIPYLQLEGQKKHEVLYSLPIPSAAAPSLWTGIVLNVGAYENNGGWPLIPGQGGDWNALVLKIGAQVPAIRRMLVEAWTRDTGRQFRG